MAKPININSINGLTANVQKRAIHLTAVPANTAMGFVGGGSGWTLGSVHFRGIGKKTA